MNRTQGELVPELEMIPDQGASQEFPETGHTRQDILGESLPLCEVLRNAPTTDGPFITVPKVLE
jgi:Asp-tRNA(Asn)/Glu-tRNA(Gln) amidotransferase C subunit